MPFTRIKIKSPRLIFIGHFRNDPNNKQSHSIFTKKQNQNEKVDVELLLGQFRREFISF